MIDSMAGVGIPSPHENEKPLSDKPGNKNSHSFRLKSACKCNLLRWRIRFNVYRNSSAVLLFILFVIDASFGSMKVATRKKRYNPMVYPSNSEIEVAWELGIPIGLEGKDVEVGLFLEADYSLPDNITYLYPDNILDKYTGKRRKRRWSSRKRRSAGRRKGGPVTRAAAFIALETTMDSLGIDGHNCLLRNICESALTPLYHGSLVAELLHVLFTPSTTTENELDSEYHEAEELGRLGGDCNKAYPSCSLGLLDMISRVEDDDDEDF